MHIYDDAMKEGSACRGAARSQYQGFAFHEAGQADERTRLSPLLFSFSSFHDLY